MLRVALIGCGKIADQHLWAIQRIAECQVVAVCDREILMAQQLAERFGIAETYADAQEMLAQAKPDVVHITTPPQSHFSLGRACLEAGCHVYLEKPFTVTAGEAEALVRLAETRGLKLTAGHNLQFTLEMLKMRERVQRGFLGGKAVHVESYFSYGLDDTSYVGPLLSSRNHWVRQLPGQLFHNIISHGVAKLAEFLDDELVEISAHAHQSAKLHAMGGQEVLDELRVLIRDARGTTAFFCFTTQINPGRNELRILGPKGSITVDHATGSLILHQSRPNKSYLTYVVPPIFTALEHLRNSVSNLVDFVRQRLYQDAGIKELIERFYTSVRTRGEPPLPYREILLTAQIMDAVFAQIYAPAEELPLQRTAVG
ncbi:MAG TPA: Gfo/Idh/MocA family oxidoreductase [Chthoniobacterales bacterium]